MAGRLHMVACRRFGDAVIAAEGKWDRRSPCDGWQARDVLEHVIGFHDVLLLGPLGLKPNRPRDDPRQRWELTLEQLDEALSRDNLFRQAVQVPAVGNNPATQFDAGELVARLTRDVLVHTWDLARAVGADDRLDPRLCAMFLDQLPSDVDALSSSGMFGAPVAIGDHADVQSRLLGRLGRDPSWCPPD